MKKIEFFITCLLWAGTSRPIIWNKNLRSLCVSAGWMYNLRIYIYIFLMDNWLCTWYFIFYVKKFGGFFNICFSFMLCNTHAIYTAVSVWPIYRYNVISFFDTPLNLTISFVNIFSRGFKQRISSELIDIHIV